MRIVSIEKEYCNRQSKEGQMVMSFDYFLFSFNKKIVELCSLSFISQQKGRKYLPVTLTHALNVQKWARKRAPRKIEQVLLWKYKLVHHIRWNHKGKSYEQQNLSFHKLLFP